MKCLKRMIMKLFIICSRISRTYKWFKRFWQEYPKCRIRQQYFMVDSKDMGMKSFAILKLKLELDQLTGFLITHEKDFCSQCLSQR